MSELRWDSRGGPKVQAGLTLERMGLWVARGGGSSQEPGKGTPEPREPECKKATLDSDGNSSCGGDNNSG